MSASDDLTVEEGPVGDAHLIAVTGELDHSTAWLLSDALRRATVAGEGGVVVDLCDVGFIDSAGISTLLNALRRLTRQRRRLLVVCPPGRIRRVFELLGLIGTFQLTNTREEALAAA